MDPYQSLSRLTNSKLITELASNPIHDLRNNRLLNLVKKIKKNKICGKTGVEGGVGMEGGGWGGEGGEGSMFVTLDIWDDKKIEG